MGIKTSRQKPKNILLSLIYRLQKILPLSNAARFKLFLNLEWIFDRLSHEMSFKLYSTDNHPARQYSKKFILENIQETDTVLDLGSNLGDISFFIAEKAKEVVGIDHNAKAIELSKQRHKRPNLEFHNGEAREFLNSNAKQFDVLILSHVLEHLDNPKDFLMDFKGFFKKIYIEVPDFDKYYLNHYRKDHKLSLIYSDKDHVSEFDREELKALLNECNIQIVKEEYRYGIQKLWCTV
jgi:2-polyprenyl-3-methyl-5-hydroxy-6-metoxy-1,4-benzoquinol methylase